MAAPFVKKAFNIVTSVMPWLIIGGLLYAALFVKPQVAVENLPEPALGTRDFYYGLAMPDNDVLWLAGSWGKIIRSDDGGKTWTIQQTPTRENLQGIVAWDTDRAIAVGNEGIAIRTEDGGKTWVEVNDIPKSPDRNKLISVRAQPNGVAWAVGLSNAILRTDDYGKTWVRTDEEMDRVWTDVGFAGNRVFLVGEFGETRYSDDNGKTWVDGRTPVEQTLNAVKFRDAMNGVAVGGQGDVIYTSDAGKTWTKAPTVTDKHLYDAVWLGDRWFAVGDKGRYVEGSGQNWKEGRLAFNDLSWHTRIAVRNDTPYITGASVGFWKDGKWHRFSDAGTEVVE